MRSKNATHSGQEIEAVVLAAWRINRSLKHEALVATHRPKRLLPPRILPSSTTPSFRHHDDFNAHVVWRCSQMRQEIEVMRNLYHRSVVLLFEVLEEREEWEDPEGFSEGRVCMVQEYMEGGATLTYDDETGLFKRPNAGGSAVGTDGRASGGGAVASAYSEDEAKPLFRDLVQGLLYLHGKGIVHRDIKVFHDGVELLERVPASTLANTVG